VSRITLATAAGTGEQARRGRSAAKTRTGDPRRGYRTADRARPWRHVDRGRGGPRRERPSTGGGHRGGALALDAFLGKFARQQPSRTPVRCAATCGRRWEHGYARSPPPRQAGWCPASSPGPSATRCCQLPGATGWSNRREPGTGSCSTGAIERGEIPANNDTTSCSTCCSAPPATGCRTATGHSPARLSAEL
jgi:hypothetical protein